LFTLFYGAQFVTLLPELVLVFGLILQSSGCRMRSSENSARTWTR